MVIGLRYFNKVCISWLKGDLNWKVVFERDWIRMKVDEKKYISGLLMYVFNGGKLL